MRFGSVAAVQKQDKPSSLVDHFRQDLEAGLQDVLTTCASFIEAADQAATALQKLQDSVTALKNQKSEKTARGDALRAEASEAVADGKDAAQIIRARAEIMGEISALEDLISDTQEQRLPEAQKAFDAASASLIERLTSGVISLRRSLQEKHIGGMITAAGEMAEAYMAEMKKLAAVHTVPSDSIMAFRHSQIYTPLDLPKMR